MALTDCALVTDYSIDCRDSVGGLKKIYITEWQNLSSTTVSSGVCTAITLVAGKKFWIFDVAKGTASSTDTLTASVENGTRFYTQTVNTVLHKMTAANRNIVEGLERNLLLVVTEDNNGNKFIYGRQRGMDVLTGEGASGVAFGDLNGYTLAMTGMEPARAESVTATLDTTA